MKVKKIINYLDDVYTELETAKSAQIASDNVNKMLKAISEASDKLSEVKDMEKQIEKLESKLEKAQNKIGKLKDKINTLENDSIDLPEITVLDEEFIAGSEYLEEESEAEEDEDEELY